MGRGRLAVSDECVDRGAIGKIESRRRELLIGASDREMLRQRGRLRGCRPVGEVHVVACACEHADDRGAEPASSAGDDHTAALAVFRHYPGSRPITNDAFWPPNPKELESAWRTGASRATLGTTSSGIAGSGTRQLIVGGLRWFC